MWEQMITAATMRIQSQTGRICSLNLITGTQPVCRQETSAPSVCLRKPVSADRQRGGEPVVEISEIISNLFFLVNQQLGEEVMNGTFVWLKLLKRALMSHKTVGELAKRAIYEYYK